jgi:hypothetical protein
VYVKGPRSVIVAAPPDAAVVTATAPALAVAFLADEVIQAAKLTPEISVRNTPTPAIIDIRVDRFMAEPPRSLR